MMQATKPTRMLKKKKKNDRAKYSCLAINRSLTLTIDGDMAYVSKSLEDRPFNFEGGGEGSGIIIFVHLFTFW